MALVIEEKKARRMAGMMQMTPAQRVHRTLTGGRPPASEMKSPTAAIGAARVLRDRLQREMIREGLDPESVKHGVAIAFVSSDLTTTGRTNLLTDATQDAALGLIGQDVPIGLLFGIHDPAPDDEWHVQVGARAFLNIAQTDEWLSPLAHEFPLEVIDPA